MENTESISRKVLLTVWVAGLFDGEGTIGIYIHKRKDRENPRVTKHITIENTNSLVIEEYKKFLRENNIKFYYCYLPSRKNRISSPIYSVNVSSYRMCEKLLNLLFPYLVGKKEQAQTMLDFIQYKKEIGWQTPVLKLEEFVNKIKQQKKSPETIRQTS